MTRTSAALQAAKDGAPEGKVRFHTVRCGLKKAVRTQAFADLFAHFAAQIGTMRHVVTLVANELVLGEHASIVRDWFHWYTQVWSAVDYAVDKSRLGSGNPLIAPVRAILDTHSELLDQLRTVAPERCPVLMREQECNALATATKAHLGQFAERLLAVLRVRITQVLWEIVGDASKAVKASLAARNTVLSDTDDDLGSRAALERLGLTAECVDRIRAICVEERERLGPLVMSQDKSERWFYVLDKSKRLYEFLPHLRRYSVEMTEVLEREMLCRPQEEHEAPHERERRKWNRERKPRPFAILPISPLRPSMVYYGYTEVDALYSNIHKEETAEYRRRATSKKRKRKHADEASGADEGSADDGAPTRFTPDRVKFAEAILKDLRPEGERRDGEWLPVQGVRTGWTLINFRTNGVCLTLTFASGTCAHVSGIREARGKGLYIGSRRHGHGSRYRGEGCGTWPVGRAFACSRTDFDVVAVDPGILKPIQCCMVSATAASVCENVSFDSMDEAPGCAFRAARPPRVGREPPAQELGVHGRKRFVSRRDAQDCRLGEVRELRDRMRSHASGPSRRAVPSPTPFAGLAREAPLAELPIPHGESHRPDGVAKNEARDVDERLVADRGRARAAEGACAQLQRRW